jgi:hypothetical protein
MFSRPILVIIRDAPAVLQDKSKDGKTEGKCPPKLVQIDLRNNFIAFKGAMAIAKALRSLEYPDAREEEEEERRKVQEAAKGNRPMSPTKERDKTAKKLQILTMLPVANIRQNTLQGLNLVSAGLDFCHLVILCELLKDNTSIETLDLGSNAVAFSPYQHPNTTGGSAGAECVANVLKVRGLMR